MKYIFLPIWIILFTVLCILAFVLVNVLVISAYVVWFFKFPSKQQLIDFNRVFSKNELLPTKNGGIDMTHKWEYKTLIHMALKKGIKNENVCDTEYT